MVDRYFSVTLGTDLYGQSEDESCLGMLQGCACVEHGVRGGDKTEENTCFFWLAPDVGPVGALRWARDGCIGKPQVDEHGDTSEKVADVRTAGGGVEAHVGTGRAISCWSGVLVRSSLKITGCTR